MLRQSLSYTLLAAFILTTLLWIGSYTFLQGDVILMGPRQYFVIGESNRTFHVAIARWYGPSPWMPDWKIIHESHADEYESNDDPDSHQLGPFTFFNEHAGPGNFRWTMALGCSHWLLFLLTTAAAAYTWRKRRPRQSAFPVIPPSH